MSIAIVSGDELPLSPRRKRIDIWWRGKTNGSLMLLLGHLLMRNWEWARAKLRLIRLIEDGDGREPALAALQKLLSYARVDARAEVIVSQEPFSEVLQRESADADCVLLGFLIPEDAELSTWHANYERLLADMPTTILINSRHSTDLLE